ncbi:MAG TPA: 50S ribosomal protein L35 [Clostridiales bacterium]|nr:50S ribosomal protein L35 [Clostridiales bacterium]
MPKMKTHKGASKRMKVTGTGKVTRMHTHHVHKLVKKSSRRKRRLKKRTLVHPTEQKKAKRLLPYL